MKKIPLFTSLLVLLACWLTLSVAGALVSPSVLARTTDPLTPPAPAAETVTILFDPTPAGEPQTYTVKKGSPLPEIPAAPSLPAARFLGWYDENGVQVHPSRYTPIQKSAVYTARWQRRLDELLELNVHKTYISGRANGLFGPNDPLSRAEACQMIYTLLKTHSWPKKQFSDVHSDAWYAPAVETLAGLGVLSGRPDGTFAPDQPMSRAEFVTLVTNLNFSRSGRSVFPDTQGHWAETRIAAANEAGWISGQPDGSFAPEASITRVQAVTVLNRVLGRPATAALQTCTDAKGFCDVFPEHWAYGDILEASTAHQYTRSAGKETWSTYEKAVLPTTGKWIRENGALYYVEPSTGKCARGDRKIDGTEYKFDPVTGQAYTGFAQRQGWRRYYLDGALQEDLSGLGVVEGP